MSKEKNKGSKLVQATPIDEKTHRMFTVLCYQHGVAKQDVMRVLVEHFCKNERLQRAIVKEVVE